jgi:DNA-binding Lrp family transcriptional regulator
MLSNNQLLVLNEFRKNARVKLTYISRKNNVPVSTLFDAYSFLVRKKFILRHTSLLDFRKEGFLYRAIVMVPKPSNDKIFYLSTREEINSIFSCSDDIILDVVFKNLKELMVFIEEIKHSSGCEVSWFEISECILLENKVI